MRLCGGVFLRLTGLEFKIKVKVKGVFGRRQRRAQTGARSRLKAKARAEVKGFSGCIAVNITFEALSLSDRGSTGWVITYAIRFIS